MVADLDIPVEILPVKTTRDEHGLALSSRNAYLSDEERAIARQLNTVLARTAQSLRAGAEGAHACAEAELTLRGIGFTGVDYVAFADPDTLEPLVRFEGKGRLLAAVRLGKTRLIDNTAV
jgi:pantoate--beta-alanine ligase